MEYVGKLEQENDAMRKLVLDFLGKAVGTTAMSLLFEKGLVQLDAPYEKKPSA